MFYKCNPWGPYVDDSRSVRLAYLVATSVDRKGAQSDHKSYRYALAAVKTVDGSVQSFAEMRSAMLNLVAKGMATRSVKE